MSNRFPPLAAPLRAPRSIMSALPHWLRSFPVGELLVLSAFGVLLALA